MSVESATACKDMEPCRGGIQESNREEAGAEEQQQLKLSSSGTTLSALGNQQKDHLLRQLDRLKQDFNEKAMPLKTNEDAAGEEWTIIQLS